MSSPGIRRLPIAGLCLAAVAAAVTVGAAPATATTDSTPPSVPQNLRTVGSLSGNAMLAWDASSDDSGSVRYYWLLVDGGHAARPSVTTYNIQTLVDLCRITKGPHTVSVQAVDWSLNRSAPSNGIEIFVS